MGTNPEELIAAAHAGCFSMALSAQLDGAGLKADAIDTKAALTFEKTDAGFTITKIHLELRAKIPNASDASVPEGRGRRQGRLPGLARAQHGDHAGRKLV